MIFILRLIILLFLCFPALAADEGKKTIYLISSSSDYNEAAVQNVVAMFEAKGFAVSTQYLQQQISDFGYVNTDRMRAQTLISALTDDQVQYLWFMRGGNGAFKLIPYLSKAKARIEQSKPKILIGFSDVTALHLFVNKQLNWPSVHGVLAEFNKEMHSQAKPDGGGETVSSLTSIDSVMDAIANGVDYKGLIPLNAAASQGANGDISGGNFSLIQAAFDTIYDYDFNNNIVMIEDVGTSYRQLDRGLEQLLHKKSFKPAGLVFGQFYPIGDGQGGAVTDAERLIYKSVIEDFARKVTYPVYYYPYFGHGAMNVPFNLHKPASVKCLANTEYCEFTQPPLLSQ